MNSTFLREYDRFQPKTTMATIGMFDGCHVGHLQIASELMDYSDQRDLASLVVTFNQHPRHVLTGTREPKMINSRDERFRLIADKMMPHYILPLDFTPELAALSAKDFLVMLRDRYGVAALLVGYNHHFGHERDLHFPDYVEIGRQVGVEVVRASEYLGRHAPVSSTIIRSLIKAGRVLDARALMDYRSPSVTGTVVHGFANGRDIGFPTANVGNINPDIILPHNGAYAVTVILDDGVPRWGMANVGRRPTLDNGQQISVEVNIFDFNEDIYGERIRVEFFTFLRLEVKMGSLDELKEQLAQDKENAIEFFTNYYDLL